MLLASPWHLRTRIDAPTALPIRRLLPVIDVRSGPPNAKREGLFGRELPIVAQCRVAHPPFGLLAAVVANGAGKTFFEIDLVAPAELVQARAIEQLARHAIRFARIPTQFARGAARVARAFNQFTDRHLLARADVHPIGRIIQAEQEDRSVGQVVHVQELSQCHARAPHVDDRVAALTRLLELAK